MKDELLEVKTEVKEELDDSEDALNDIMEANPSMSGSMIRKERWVVLVVRFVVVSSVPMANELLEGGDHCRWERCSSESVV